MLKIMKIKIIILFLKMIKSDKKTKTKKIVIIFKIFKMKKKTKCFNPLKKKTFMIVKQKKIQISNKKIKSSKTIQISIFKI